MNPYVDTLVSGLDQLGFLIGRVTEDDLGKPTPCADWTVAAAGADPRWNTAEIAVHGWDLAQALGVSTSQLDDAVAQDGLDFMSANLTADKRGPVFGPELEAPEGAGVYERLAAFAGRRPLAG